MCRMRGWGADSGAWLAPFLAGMTRLADVARLDLTGALRGRLGWEVAARLDRELPGFLALPGGRAVVEYGGAAPVVRARCQAFYGLDATPVLAGGRVGVVLALLSPAGREVALTRDLAGFWRGGWGGCAAGDAGAVSAARLAGAAMGRRSAAP